MTVTVDTKKELTVITCNTCKKESFTVKGLRSKRAGYTKAIELGWRWKDANTQIGPACRKLETKTKEVKSTGKKAEKAAAPKAKVTLFGRKNSKPAGKPNSAPTFTAGQSIGKVARSAKVNPAPAAE